MRSFIFISDAGSERFTFSFTIKDSPEHFINVSAWGNEEYIQGLSSRFQIGDCGEILCSNQSFRFQLLLLTKTLLILTSNALN